MHELWWTPTRDLRRHAATSCDVWPIRGDFSALLEAARRGTGAALLSELVCAPAVGRGELDVVLPDWSVAEGTMHFVYPSRRGMLPEVRALVDFLAEHVPATTLARHAQCKKRPVDDLPACPCLPVRQCANLGLLWTSIRPDR